LSGWPDRCSDHEIVIVHRLQGTRIGRLLNPEN
jgi:hypothetical protein